MVHTVYSFTIHLIAVFVTDISKQHVCLVYKKISVIIYAILATCDHESDIYMCLTFNCRIYRLYLHISTQNHFIKSNGIPQCIFLLCGLSTQSEKI